MLPPRTRSRLSMSPIRSLTGARAATPASGTSGAYAGAMTPVQGAAPPTLRVPPDDGLVGELHPFQLAGGPHGIEHRTAFGLADEVRGAHRSSVLARPAATTS